jgi:hypothetical protein
MSVPRTTTAVQRAPRSPRSRARISARARVAPRTAAPPTVPIQLVALGGMLDVSGPAYVHTKLCAAARDAEDLLRQALTRTTDDLERQTREYAAVDLLLTRARDTKEFRALESIGPQAETAGVSVVIDVAEQGLWLGIALAHRFFEQRR